MPDINNHDIAGLCRRIRRYAEEVHKAASSNVAAISDADKGRLVQFFAAMRAHHAWFTAQPQLDIPKTAPQVIPLQSWPEFTPIENESLRDIIHLGWVLWNEMINCNSARMPSGMDKFDSKRFNDIMTKLEAFLTEYVEKATPVDLPESSPSQPQSGPGRIGV